MADLPNRTARRKRYQLSALVALGLVLVAAAGGAVWADGRLPGTDPAFVADQLVASPAPQAQTAATVDLTPLDDPAPIVDPASDSALNVVAIGDSIMAGSGLNGDEAWLAIVAETHGWKLTNLASNGSGFVTVGDDGDTFSDQTIVALSLHPDVIILSGSSNDLGVSNAVLANATTALIERIHLVLPQTIILTVDAIWGDTDLPGQLSQMDASVKLASARAGGAYLDIGQPLSGTPNLMQADGVHPNAVGQAALAQAFDVALEASGLNL